MTENLKNFKSIKVVGRAATSNKDIQYYVNSNKTMLLIYNKAVNKVFKEFSGDWGSRKIDCELVAKDQDGNKKTFPSEKISLKDLVSDDVDFIQVVSTTSSTVKPTAYFTETDPITGIEKHIFNEFIGSTDFIKARDNNKYSSQKDIIKLLQTETPNFFTLIKNLFFNESDAVIENFINWLSTCAYKDKNQDIIFLFFGTNEIDEGQGAGKGVLRNFLSMLLSNLVVPVSAKSYDDNFNGELLNKKIVIFDEVDFKLLNYAAIKDVTGSPTIRVEFKGKDAIACPNVSSWLMFTNQHDLCGKVTFEDRRTFLIRPNPKNGSLDRIANKKYGGMEKFIESLTYETQDLIQILALCTKNKVLSPLNLHTKAKLDYFKALNETNVVDIKELEKLLTNKNFNRKVCDILKNNNLEKHNKIIQFLKNDCINFKSFEILFKLLKDNGFIGSLKCLFAWEKLKEHSFKNDFHMITVDFKKTKKHEKYRDKTVLIKTKVSGKNLKKLKASLRYSFGKVIH